MHLLLRASSRLISIQSSCSECGFAGALYMHIVVVSLCVNEEIVQCLINLLILLASAQVVSSV